MYRVFLVAAAAAVGLAAKASSPTAVFAVLLGRVVVLGPCLGRACGFDVGEVTSRPGRGRG